MRKILSGLFLALVLAFASGGFALAQGVGAGIAGPPTTCTLSSCATNSAAGFQQNGSPLITGGSAPANPVTLGGLNAGAALTLSTALWETYLGCNAGQHDANSSGENVGIGCVSLWQLTTGTDNTGVGLHACGSFQTDGNRFCGGDDSGRNSVGQGGSTFTGKDAGRNGGSSSGSTTNGGYGFQSLMGNAASISVGGTKTTGNVISLVFTASGSSPYTLPGNPVTVSYTVLSGDTLATIATALCNAIAANSSLAAAAPVAVTCYQMDPLNSQAFVVDFAGTSATGLQLAVTYTQGGNTETITVGGGSSGADNFCGGDRACLYSGATTATQNIGLGSLVLAEQTTGNEDVAIGGFASEFLSGANDTQNAVVGYAAGQGALGLTDYYHTTLIGALAGNALHAANNDLLLGWQACLTCTTASNGIYIGANVETGVAATTSQQLVIGVSVAAPNVNFAVNIDNVLTGTGNGATNPTTCSIGQSCIIGVLRSANLNVTTDQSVTIAPMTSGNAGFLSTATKYIVTGMFVTNCSTAASTAAGGLYDAASKGGNPLVAAAQTYTSCASASTMQTATLAAIATTTVETTATLFFSLTAGHGSAATGDVYVLGIPFN